MKANYGHAQALPLSTASERVQNGFQLVDPRRNLGDDSVTFDVMRHVVTRQNRAPQSYPVSSEIDVLCHDIQRTRNK